MAEQRSTSPRLPGGSIVGPQVTGAFCGAVAAASDLINLDAKSALAAIATIAVAVILIALFVGLTRWGPVDLDAAAARRAFGQLVRAARQLYGRHWLVLVAIGLTAIPIVGGANLLAGLLPAAAASTRPPAPASTWRSATWSKRFGRPVASAIVAAVVIVFVRELVDGAAGRLPRLLARDGAALLARRRGPAAGPLGILLLAITVIGLPWAIYKYVAWQFVQQEILFDDKGVREAFHGSSDLVRGRWWHTVRVAGFLWLVSIVIGPVLGFALIFINLSLLWINLIGSLVFALLIPYVALGDTLLYFDLGARAEEPSRRSRGAPGGLAAARVGAGLEPAPGRRRAK